MTHATPPKLPPRPALVAPAPRRRLTRFPGAASLNIGDYITVGGTTYQVQAGPKLAAGTPPPPISVNLGDTLLIAGQSYTVGPSLTLQGQPPPPPPVIAIQYRNTTRNFITSCHPGDVVIFDVGTDAAKLAAIQAATKVMFGTVPATTVAPNATGLQVTVPSLGTTTVTVTPEVDGAAGPITTGPPLAVVPAGVPLPAATGPTIRGIVTSQGAALTGPPADGVLVVRGDGFGTEPGTATLFGLPVTVTSWTDSAVTVRLDPASGLWKGTPGTVGLRRTDGAYHTVGPLW